jgi:hypothetical protein
MKKIIFFIYLLPIVCFEKASFSAEKTKLFEKARFLEEISTNPRRQQTIMHALQSADCSKCCCCDKGFTPEYSLQHVFGCQCKNLICCGAHLADTFCPKCKQRKNQSAANEAYGNSDLLARLIEDNRSLPQWTNYQNFNPNLFNEETSWPIINVVDKCPQDLAKIIAAGANVNVTDLSYNTPLEFALKKIGKIGQSKETKAKLIEAVYILINNGAKLNLISTYRGKSCTIGYLLAQFAPECLPLAHQKGLDIVSAEVPEDLDLLDGLLENCDSKATLADCDQLITNHGLELTNTNLLSTYHNPLLFSYFFKKNNLQPNHKLLHAAFSSSNYSVLGTLLTKFKENIQKNSSFYSNTESGSPENNYCLALLDTYNNPNFSKLKLKPVENFVARPLSPLLVSPDLTTAEVIDGCESNFSVKSNINEADIDGYTPLQKTVIHHLTSKVQYLLQSGADPQARNMLNESARSINKRLCHYYLTCLQKNFQNYQGNGNRQEYRDTRRHLKDLYSCQLAINKILNKK